MHIVDSQTVRKHQWVVKGSRSQRVNIVAYSIQAIQQLQNLQLHILNIESDLHPSVTEGLVGGSVLPVPVTPAAENEQKLNQ